MAYPAVGDAGTDTVAPPNDWASKLLATLAVHSDTSGNLVAATAKLGTNPAASGTLRIPNFAWMAARNVANGGDINMFRVDANDRIGIGAQLYRSDDSTGFGWTGSFLKLRTVRNLTASGIYPTIDIYNSYKGMISVGDRNEGMRITVADDATVVNKTITAMSRVGTTVTVTAATHGFASGDRVGIETVVHTFNAEVNGAWTVANPTTNTFDITVPGLSSGTYTSGGKTSNRPMMYGIEVDINPAIARTGLSGTALNADDVCGVAVYNGGTAKGTDAIYLDHNPAIVGSAWLTAVSINTAADYAIYIGKTQALAGVWMHGTFSGPGLLMDGTFSTYGIDMNAGTFTSGEIRLKNTGKILARNNAASADLTMLTSNSSDEIIIGQAGGKIAIPGTVSFRLGAGAGFTTDTGTGSKIGFAANEKWAFHGATPVVQHSTTGETVGFTAGGGTTVTDASTFTGNVGATAYRLSDVVKALKNKGILQS